MKIPRRKKIPRSPGECFFTVLAYIFITLLCVASLYPFLNVVSLSFSTASAASRYGFTLIPREFTIQAYTEAFSSDGIAIGFRTSILRTVLGTLTGLSFVLLGAYPLSKRYLPHRHIWTIFIVVTMFAGGQLFLIPNYLLIRGIGLMDSLGALIVPSLGNTFAMLVVRNYLMTLPEDLEESAKLEGANDFVILFKIVIPMAMPVIATITLWIAVYHWNAWFDAMIFITNRNLMVLPIYLRKLIIESNAFETNRIMPDSAEQMLLGETVKSAVLLISTLPILVVYPFLQKHFTKGMLIGALKG